MDNALKESQIKLLRSVARGDRQAFEHLYRQSSPWLFAVALRMLRNRALAEEVLHDSFLIIWNRSATYNSALSSPITWLTHIVRNRCIDRLRSHSHLSVEHEEEYEETQQVAFTEHGDERYRPDHTKKLEECLKHLENSQRQSVVLAYYQGMTHLEIADWLGQPLGTVKSWIRRALEHLKTCVNL